MQGFATGGFWCREGCWHRRDSPRAGKMLLFDRILMLAQGRLASIFESICGRYYGKAGKSEKLIQANNEQPEDLSKVYIRWKAHFSGFFSYTSRQFKSRMACTVCSNLCNFSFNVNNTQTAAAENRWPKDTQSGCKRHTKLWENFSWFQLKVLALQHPQKACKKGSVLIILIGQRDLGIAV